MKLGDFSCLGPARSTHLQVNHTGVDQPAHHVHEKNPTCTKASRPFRKASRNHTGQKTLPIGRTSALSNVPFFFARENNASKDLSKPVYIPIYLSRLQNRHQQRTNSITISSPTSNIPTYLPYLTHTSLNPFPKNPTSQSKKQRDTPSPTFKINGRCRNPQADMFDHAN